MSLLFNFVVSEGEAVDHFNVLFGLGIFLYGMSQLEYGISKQADARLRAWLRTGTGTRLGSVSTGIVATALLQSSSMISLLVLAFASAGILPLLNAVGILLGANLGTTFTGWIVAAFGFKMDLEAIALPILGCSAFALVGSKRDTGFSHSAFVMLGIGLLLFGLGIMKGSMEALSQAWDVTILQGHHPVIYLAFGVFITFIVQSSSAVMMMALAALNAGFINLPEAAALVIGADLGTTSTTVLGSLTGNVIKRQLAFAHFTFNLVVDLSAFLLLLPAIPLLMSLANMSDPLYSLVAFHSLINLIGLAVFLPFLSQYTRWIEHVFSKRLTNPSGMLDRVPAEVPDAALVALEETVKQLLIKASCNSLRIFALKPEQLKIVDANRSQLIGSITHKDFIKGYEELKTSEGHVFSYSLQIQRQPLVENQVRELERLQMIVRKIVFGNKSLKDIQKDLDDLKYANPDSMRELYDLHKLFQKTAYEKLIDLILADHESAFIQEQLAQLGKDNDQHAQRAIEFVLSHAEHGVNEGTAMSIQLNVNREIHQALKTFLEAFKLWSSTPLN
ncbi:MAG: phosphate:Na+ symporter [Pseudohongiellaceae bacterium]